MATDIFVADRRFEGTTHQCNLCGHALSENADHCPSCGRASKAKTFHFNKGEILVDNARRERRRV
jgi:hypothetical protein